MKNNNDCFPISLLLSTLLPLILIKIMQNFRQHPMYYNYPVNPPTLLAPTTSLLLTIQLIIPSPYLLIFYPKLNQLLSMTSSKILKAPKPPEYDNINNNALELLPTVCIFYITKLTNSILINIYHLAHS